ncbi:hypothetical protein Tco_0173296 [Tanacetum coccineum]
MRLRGVYLRNSYLVACHALSEICSQDRVYLSQPHNENLCPDQHPDPFYNEGRNPFERVPADPGNQTANPPLPQPTVDSIERLASQPPPLLDVIEMEPPLPPLPPQLPPFSQPMWVMTDPELKAYVQKQCDEDDAARQEAIMGVITLFGQEREAKEDLRKQYAECKDISLERRALIDKFLDDEAWKDSEVKKTL